MGKVVTIREVQSAYREAMLETQVLYADRRNRDTAGAVRYKKSEVVESASKDLITIAWASLGGDLEDLRMDKSKVRITTNREVYKLSQDIHVYLHGVFTISVECKAYTEVAMYKRILMDAKLLKDAVPTISAFFVVQLENFLGGDYGYAVQPRGSESVLTLNRVFPDLHVEVLTLLDGNRDIRRPLHVPQFFKALKEQRLNYAVDRFAQAMASSVAHGGDRE